MVRIVAAAIGCFALIAAARVAVAGRRGHSCHRGCALWWELGGVALRFDPGSLQPSPTADRAIVGYAARLRSTLGPGGTPLYVAIEWDAGVVTSATTEGQLFGSKAVLGAHWISGSISYGGELAAGIRFVNLDDRASPDVSASILQPVVEVRAKADVWLSPHVTIGAAAGVDALDPQDLTLAVMLGAHVYAWDFMR